jgi:protocatechuate 3,4-dioxygenase beta subunit
MVRAEKPGKEKNVKPDTISLRRRHLIIAGFAGAAVPFAVFAGPREDAAVGAAGTRVGAENMILSGRILAAHGGKPLAGAMVEVWSDLGCAACQSVAADADGRFMFMVRAPADHSGRRPHIRYRVTHNGHTAPVKRLYLDRGAGIADESIAHVERDDKNILRASFGVSLA